MPVRVAAAGAHPSGTQFEVLVRPEYLPDPTAVIISDVSGTRHDDLVGGKDVSIALDGDSALIHPT